MTADRAGSADPEPASARVPGKRGHARLRMWGFVSWAVAAADPRL